MDVFKLLGAGAKFDRKRFRDDHAAFAPAPVEKTVDRTTNLATLESDDFLPASLDFFGSAAGPIPSAKPQQPHSFKRLKAPKEANRANGKGNSKSVAGNESSLKRAILNGRRKRKAGSDEEVALGSNGEECGDDAEEDSDRESGPEGSFRKFSSPSAKSDTRHEVGDEDADDNDDEDDEQQLVEFKTQEEVNIFRKRFKIKTVGTDVPNPVPSFTVLADRFNLAPYLRQNLTSLGFARPTPIQMQSTPIMLHGRELIAIAPTGSGKTLAFVVPILHDLGKPDRSGVRAMIVSPTRELANQIHREISSLTKGRAFKSFVLSKSHLAGDSHKQFGLFDILITTPLRLVHAIKNNVVDLSKVRHLVLDEADKLLELGGYLFSATMPSGIERLARTFMVDPIRVLIGHVNAATDTIKQMLTYVSEESGKLIEIRQMVHAGMKPPVLIFVQSVERARELFHELVYDGINVDVIHAERTKAQRDAVIQSFRTGKTWVLIATDLMARGIDFKGVSMVINYDFPQSVQSYIHRIGRTGRAGRPGEAVTFFTKSDAEYLKIVVNVMKESGCEVPEWMLQLHNPSWLERKRLKINPVERETIRTVSAYDLKKQEKKRAMIEASKRRKEGARKGGPSSSAKTRK
ncbi:putative ATP-dependent RNA helicase DDX52 [Zopfochytrium polystomum]|nr:putative ATP-dependent RNA helicase DDX52 [Zopfochytrium polystomum]